MSIYGIWSLPSPRPHFPFSSAAISLLRFCRVLGYVYIFPLSCLLRLFYCLKFPRVLSRGIIRWAWYFFTDFTSKCISSENFLWFELNCRNVSGSLGKQEMIWEQEVVSTCFNNFPFLLQTWTSYRNTADYRIYNHLEGNHLSAAKFSVKRKIATEKLNRKVFNIKGRKPL